MKNLLLFLVAAAVGSAAAVVTVLLVSPAKSNGESSAETVHQASHAQPTTEPEGAAKLRGDIDRLSAELAQLEGTVESLRSGADRTPASLAASSEEKFDGDGELATLSPKARDQVRDVLNEEFQRQADERKAKQAEQDKAAAQRRAERTATNLKLGASDTQKLADFYVEANQKRRELFANAQGANLDRQARRESFQAMLDWQTAELTKQFGADLATQIQAADRPGRGGRGQGGGRGGRGAGNTPPTPPTDAGRGGTQKQ